MTSRPRGPARWLGGIRRIPPAAWLGVAIVAYFAASLALSWQRAVELQTTTWDLGLYQQALWSTAHGHPFFETADVETGGYHSLLQVHTVFLLYLLVPLYAAVPSELTLFAVQSAVVAAAAIPLYLLSRDLTRSSWLGLFAAVLFLAWTPTLSSNLYDFHPEAFLPLELFATVLFWERGRYLAGFAAATVGCLTFELAPVLLAFVGLFFLLPSGATLGRWTTSARTRRLRSQLGSDLRAAAANPRIQASLALVLVSVGAYLLLLDLRTTVLLSALGTTPLPAAPTGYVIGATPSALGLSVSYLGIGFFPKVTYWLLLLALLGFVPLLAPRALVLSLPWFVFTMFGANTNYVTLGFQYGFIAATGLLVAFCYGLPRARRVWQRLNVVPARDPARAVAAGLPRRRTRRLAHGLVIGATVLLAVNLALSPANPWMQNRGLGAAYRIAYGGGGGFAEVVALVGLIPAGAVVIASDNLFPLVANDLHAYSFFWTQNNLLALPFSPTDLPSYVLVAQNRTAAVPSWLAGVLYNSSAFGVRGVAWSSPAGTVLLFEAGYEGPLATFGTPPSAGFTSNGAALVNSEAGIPATYGNASMNSAAASAPGVVGTFLQGPWVSLSAGAYQVTLVVGAELAPGAGPVPENATAAWFGAEGFAQAQYFGATFTAGALEVPGGITVSYEVELLGPTIEFEVQGVALLAGLQVYCDAVSLRGT